MVDALANFSPNVTVTGRASVLQRICHCVSVIARPMLAAQCAAVSRPITGSCSAFHGPSAAAAGQPTMLRRGGAYHCSSRKSPARLRDAKIDAMRALQPQRLASANSGCGMWLNAAFASQSAFRAPLVLLAQQLKENV